jgi:hypothetical protein
LSLNTPRELIIREIKWRLSSPFSRIVLVDGSDSERVSSNTGRRDCNVWA